MRRITLQALTWGTVAAAVSSALWLAASEPRWAEDRKVAKAPAFPLPVGVASPVAARADRPAVAPQPREPLSR